jgi:cytochrome P450
MCIGNNFAMMEAQIILSMIERRFRMTAVAGHTVEVEPLITLRPKYGLHVVAEPRNVARSPLRLVGSGDR